MRLQTGLLTALSILVLGASAQQPAPRELAAKRTTKTIKIDGLLNEEAWKDAALMDDLTEFRPKMGAKEAFENRTEAWLMYDDEGIYFGGYCHERTKDSIAMELRGRDGFGTNDYIGLIFDTYYDKINGFEYFVTPLNEQWDAKMAPPSPDSDNGGEDFSWNAVWESGAVIHNDGWSFEMFIPYAAIRFGKKDIQTWGLNITRRRRKTEQQYTWNPIDINVNGFLTQEGTWKGITNIKPPLRLQFSPYFSVYGNHFPVNKAGQKNWTGQVNGGMDVKFGINQAFTLDATLIPDFGQVQSDNQVLNLTPFEVKFNENRNFFTEGTELFSKGNLFYSRRIGGTPIHLYDAYAAANGVDTVIKNPTESKLINASKISGRTQKGLGIGILNAITKPQHATLENKMTGERTKFETDPLTNYNMLVFDQTLKYNSSISLVNTNVWRSGRDYDANVTAGLFDFNDKKNTWNVGGKLAYSHLSGYNPDGSNQNGYSSSLSFGKRSGRFNFNLWQDLTDTRFSSNDLGYFTNNNFLDHGMYVGYRWTEPRSWYNRIFLNLNARMSHLFSRIGTIDEKFQNAFIGINTNFQTKKLLWFGVFLNHMPAQHDFYEPRREGWYFNRKSSTGFGAWTETNSAKKYSLVAEVATRRYHNFYKLTALDVFMRHSFRFNSKITVSYSLNYQPRFNGVGFTTFNGNEIVFARRKVNTIENVLFAKYSFTNRMGLTFRARHYVSNVDNKEFFVLQANGQLQPSSYNQNKNQNVNFFNIDMVYTWQFAPGSFLNIVWKDAGAHFTNVVERNYFKNFGTTVESDQNNNLSLKVIYFLDYLKLKHHKKRV